MSLDTQNLVGGILITLCLVGVVWWQYVNGVSMGPWPFRWRWSYLFWNPPAYRELEPRDFWRNIILSIFRILFILAVVIAVIGHWI